MGLSAAVIPKEKLMQKQGWLQDPITTNTKKFHADQKSWHQTPMVFVDSGRPIPGQPALLKTRQYLHKTEATKMWQQLLGKGWQIVTPQWGASEDV
ncbi:MAG: DUF1651 domain-containing protein [Prochlorococcus sp.]